MGKPRIYVLACGGTIAGRAGRADDLTGYTAGQASVEELLAAVPELKEVAELSSEQVCNIDSSDMTEALWLQLARRVQNVADREDIDGIVITHGTDTLEETAYFLNLTVHTQKPLVLTGSMRPATAIAADGPLNLLEAVQAAASPELGTCGVVIVMNSLIHSARLVEKTDTTHVDAFKGRQFGQLGFMHQGKPYLYQLPVRRHTYQSAFSCPDSLPRVAIAYMYVGLTPKDLDSLLKGAAGVVLAGLGHGRMPNPVWQLLQEKMKAGLIVVRASRTLGGMVTPIPEYTGTVTADTLTPQKAKILLQLALTKTRDQEEIQQFFAAY